MYKHYGLMHERSYFAHCIHCSGDERAMMLDTKVMMLARCHGGMCGCLKRSTGIKMDS